MTFGATLSTQMAIVPIPNDDAVEFINLVLTSMDTAASLNPATATINVEDSELTSCDFALPDWSHFLERKESCFFYCTCFNMMFC